MRIGISFVVSAICFISVTQAALLENVFRIKRGDRDGGCQSKTTVLRQWMDDTSTLVAAVLNGMPADPRTLNDQNMKNNLAAFFGISFGPGGNGQIVAGDISAYRDVRDYVDSVNKFLHNQNPTFNGNQKPWLFCDSKWLKETETLYNENNGRAVQDPTTKKAANMRTYRPRNWNRLRPSNPLKSLLTKMQQGRKPNWAHYAYWSKEIKDYIIETRANRYQGRPPSFCNTRTGTTLFALTINKMLVDSVTLCNPAFTDRAEKFETIAAALASVNSRTENTDLNDVSPRALTLFHEIFHLVKPDAASKDTATKTTQCLGLVVRGRSAAARKNPDSFVLFAWSYFLTEQNAQLQWHTGNSVRDSNAMDTTKRAALPELLGSDDEVMVLAKPKPPKTSKKGDDSPPKTSAVAPPTSAAPNPSTRNPEPPKSTAPPATSKASPTSLAPSKTSTLASSKASTSKTSSASPTPSEDTNVIIGPVVVGIPAFIDWQETGDFNPAEAARVADAIENIIVTGDFPISFDNSTTNGTITAPISSGTALPTTLVPSVQWPNSTTAETGYGPIGTETGASISVPTKNCTVSGSVGSVRPTSMVTVVTSIPSTSCTKDIAAVTSTLSY